MKTRLAALLIAIAVPALAGCGNKGPLVLPGEPVLTAIPDTTTPATDATPADTAPADTLPAEATPGDAVPPATVPDAGTVPAADPTPPPAAAGDDGNG